MITFYHELCRTALSWAGPRNAEWNRRYREALDELDLVLAPFPETPLPGYPDGKPLRAPRAHDEGDESWEDGLCLLFERRKRIKM